MKKHETEKLIDELEAEVRQLIATATLLRSEDPGVLLTQPGLGRWSVIQVLEHLNAYGRYYLVAIEKALEKDKPAASHFRSGFLGDYFTRLMRPNSNGEIKNKMQAPKNYRPSPVLDAFPVLNTFVEQQHYLLTLLSKAREKHLGKIKVPISIARFIKLKLGDTFRFFIAHEQRHFVQVARTLNVAKEKTLRETVTRRGAELRRFV
jgi:hypothetical protein